MQREAFPFTRFSLSPPPPTHNKSEELYMTTPLVTLLEIARGRSSKGS